MSGELIQDKNGAWAHQDKNAYLDYSLNWADVLQRGDAIVASTWTGDDDLVLNSAWFSDTQTVIWVQAQNAVVNRWYAITNRITTQSGLIDERTIRLLIIDDTATVVANDGTIVFPNRIDAVDELKRDRLMMLAGSLLPDLGLSNDYIFSKLAAAESQVSRDLRVYLAPTVIIPDEAPQSEIDALVNAGTRYAHEASYDYTPQLFEGDQWGYIVTKQKPIISVQSIDFVYPAPTNQIYRIPNDWIRFDKKYGQIRLVPAAQAFSAPLSAFIMQALGGGRTIPFMVQVRYTAGIKDVHAEYPELVDCIKKLAVLKIIEDAYLPQSGSISADGLSQSLSVDVSKYHESVDRALNGAPGSNGGLTTAIHGIRLTVA